MGHTISGTFTLYDDDVPLPNTGNPCYGRGGYDDITVGLDVTVRDAHGTIIAADELWTGNPIGFRQCVFPFQVTHVPDSDFYQVSVGRRGSLIYSRDELDLKEWKIGFQLGDRYGD